MTIYEKIRGQVVSGTFKSIAIVAFATIIVKIVGFVKESFIGGNFGMSGLLDSYYILLLIPAFLRNVFIGAFKAVFVPGLVNSTDERDLFSKSLIVALVFSFLLLAAGVIVAPYINDHLSRNYSDEVKGLISDYQLFFYVCIPLWSVSSILTAVLDVKKKFLFSAFTPLVSGLTIIIIIWLFEVDITYLYFGYILGSALELIYLLVICPMRIGLNTRHFWTPELKTVLSQFLPKLSAGVIIGLNPVVDQYFSTSISDGAISVLNYGNKFPAFIIAILSVSATNVLLPYFSGLLKSSRDLVLRDLKMKLLMFFALGVVLAGLLALFGNELLEFFFERGRFTSSDTKRVYAVLLMYSIQIPFYVANIVVVRFLTAFNLNGFTVVSSSVAVVVNALCNYILIDQYGVKGIALSTSIVIFVSFMMKYVYVQYRFKK